MGPYTEPLILLAFLPSVPKSRKRTSAFTFCRGEGSFHRRQRLEGFCLQVFETTTLSPVGEIPTKVAKYSILPPFGHEALWTDAQKSRPPESGARKAFCESTSPIGGRRHHVWYMYRDGSVSSDLLLLAKIPLFQPIRGWIGQRSTVNPSPRSLASPKRRTAF